MVGSGPKENRGFRYGVRHAVTQAPLPLLDFVDRELSEEKNRSDLTALELIEMGSVYVDDDRCLNPSRILPEGANVRIHSSPRRFPAPNDLRSRIVSEDANTILVDKPAGLPVHALVDNIKENLLSYLEDLRGETFYITHRLDVDTSGLVLFAKSPEAQTKLNQGFVNGTIKRTYVAYVEKQIAPGDYVHFMEPSPTAPKHVEATEHEGWQRCALTVLSASLLQGETNTIGEGRTTWRLKSPASIASLTRLEIKLQTGRPQQIRAQLAALGAPIIGDTAYGSHVSLIEDGSSLKAIALRAAALDLRLAGL